MPNIMSLPTVDTKGIPEDKEAPSSPKMMPPYNVAINGPFGSSRLYAEGSEEEDAREHWEWDSCGGWRG